MSFTITYKKDRSQLIAEFTGVPGIDELINELTEYRQRMISGHEKMGEMVRLNCSDCGKHYFLKKTQKQNGNLTLIL